MNAVSYTHLIPTASWYYRHVRAPLKLLAPSSVSDLLSMSVLRSLILFYQMEKHIVVLDCMTGKYTQVNQINCSLL